jgi:hypothetical protein
MKGLACAALISALVACSDDLVVVQDDAGVVNAGGGDARVDAAVPPDTGTDSRGAVLSIDLSPLDLEPAFSPSIHDYAVHCDAGITSATLTVTDERGMQSAAVALVEDQELNVGDYWIRCLPHDFPNVSLEKSGSGTATPGYYLLNSTTYAIVLDSNGVPVWYMQGTNVNDVEVLERNTISFVPNATVPYGWNANTHLDIHRLDVLATANLMASGSPLDSHEHRLLANGDYLVSTYPITHHVDLTGLSTFGSDEDMADCVIQELDLYGHLVWSWRASDHVDAVTESLEPAVNKIQGVYVVDPFHCNSIDVDAKGNLLVSFRHTNSVLYVDRATGKTLWKLGGTSCNKDGAPYIQVTSDPETAFNMQHDARFRPNGDITLFDDHGADEGTSGEVARGVEYAIDHASGTASVVFQVLGSGESAYTGSFRRYADGDSLVGWGYVVSDKTRVATEVDPSGNRVLDVMSDGGDSYRVVKVPPSDLDIAVLRATAAK